MNYKFTESIVEEACLHYFGQLDYTYLPAPEIASDGLFAERTDYGETILKQRLRSALSKINPKVPAVAIDEAVRKVTRTDSPTLIVNNRAFHKMLTDGIPVEVRPEPSPRPSPNGRGSQYRGGFDFAGLVSRARELRVRQTPAETILWECLRSRRLQGLKFRRQHQIGDYIADFFCPEQRLVVEVDGPVHGEERRLRKDTTRDAYLESLGNQVLRFSNADVLRSGSDCKLQLIRNMCLLPDEC